MNPVPTLRPSHAEQGGNGNIARASQLLLGSPPSGLVVWETGWGWLDELIDLHCVWIIKFEFILLTFVHRGGCFCLSNYIGSCYLSANFIFSSII